MERRKKKILFGFSLFVFLLLMLFPINAQKNNSNFQRLPLDKGASINLTYDMLQDHEGYIWFGTMYGLVRFDGEVYRSFNYDPQNPNSLSFDDIISLYEDSNGNLWIGTWGGGLNRLDKNRTTFTRFLHDPQNKSGISDNIIWAITEDMQGNLWFGTETGGLNKFDDNTQKFTKINLPSTDTETNSSIQKLYTDKSGKLWIGNSERLLSFDILQNEFSAYEFTGIKKEERIFVNSVLQDKQENIWVGTHSGLFLWDKSAGVFNKSSLIKLNSITSLNEDSNGSLLIGTSQGFYVYSFQKETLSSYLHSPLNNKTIAGNYIINTFEDRSGVLWVNSYRSGIAKTNFSKSWFTNYTLNDDEEFSLSNKNIQCLTKDDAGNVYAGTYGGGINIIDESTGFVTLIKLKNNFDNVINSLAVIEDNLWIGTIRSLLTYDLKRKRFNKLPFTKPQIESLGNGTFTSLESDNENNLWIGSYNRGLFKYNFTDKSLKHYSLISEIDQNKNADYITTIYCDDQNKIWIGSYGGFHIYDSEADSFKSYTHKLNDITGLSNNYVYSFLKDKKNNMWIGTANGLNKFDPGTDSLTVYNTSYGLPNDVISSIIEDNDGNIWIGTYKGISRFSYADNSFRNFDEADGMTGNIFHPASSIISSTGIVYLGGPDGVTSFNPSEIYSSDIDVPTIISSVKLVNKEGESEIINIQDKDLTFDDSQNSFIVRFNKFDYNNAQKISYRYMLNGFHKAWYQNGTDNEVILSNIPPGEYTFVVQSSNSDGNWNNQTAEFSFVINPPFWQTWWFLAVVIAAILLIIFVVHKIIVHQKLKRVSLIQKIRNEETENVRRKTAADFHDELGHRLTRISLLTEMIKRKLGFTFNEIKPLLEQISDNSARLYDGTKDFIWAIDPQKDSLYELIIRLKDFGDELFENTNVNFVVNGLQESLQTMELDMDWKRHLSLIFKEGINNSLKHSNSSFVSIESNISGEYFEITLSDDGKGFDQNQNIKGNGLKNMLKRAELLTADLNIVSSPGSGTKISIKGKFPIKSLNYN